MLALDRSTPQLGKVTGAPLQTGPMDMPDPGILSSCADNPNPPQLAATYPLPATETFVGFTAVDRQLRAAFVGGKFGIQHGLVSADVRLP